MTDPAPSFRLSPRTGLVEQRFPGDPYPQEFDPAGWAAYLHQGEQVRAVRIPRGFRVGADHCTDGWLVLDGKKLAAISNDTFCREYELAQVAA